MKTKRVFQERRHISDRTPTHAAVMDVFPWPCGYGFTGGDVWWHEVLSHSERERLDNLIGLALLDSQLCERLLSTRDSALFSTFKLSEQTQDWLKSLQANTLEEFAEAIISTNYIPIDESV